MCVHVCVSAGGNQGRATDPPLQPSDVGAELSALLPEVFLSSSLEQKHGAFFWCCYAQVSGPQMNSRSWISHANYMRIFNNIQT